MLDVSDLKFKVFITLMASTGCRVGAIPSLKIRNLKYYPNYGLYQVTFYENTKSEYYSFTTPECANYIREYLEEYRSKICCEKLNDNSPLTRDDFVLDDLLHIQNPKHLSIFTFNYYLRLILIKTGISIVIPLTESQTGSKKNRKIVSQNHGFRKFTIMANKRINPEVREILLGRKICLSSSYYRPSESELLEEYSRVVPELTINEENRLSRQVQELKEKDDYQNYVIDKKLKEKDEQIKILTSKVDEYVEVQREEPIMSKEIAQRFSDLEEKFNDLMGIKNKERKYNCEFELESNSKTKDEKHDLMLQTTRDRIRKQGEIEQHLQKYITQ